MRVFLIVSLFTLVGCNDIGDFVKIIPKITSIDKKIYELNSTPITETSFAVQAENILEEFNSIYRLHYSIHKVFITDLSLNKWLGVCNNNIYIDKALSRDLFSVIFIHELGHCALNLDHDNTTSKMGNKLTIMNSYSEKTNPLLLEFYLKNMDNKNSETVDTIIDREGVVDNYKKYIYSKNETILINPECEKNSNRIICPKGERNILFFNETEDSGYEECSSEFYQRELSDEEREVCKKWSYYWY